MTTNRHSRAKRAGVGLAAAALFSIACSEANRAIVDNPVPTIVAALVVSDAAPAPGASLVVTVQARATDGAVGSYTAKLSYDSTALRYDGEVSIADQGLRVSNPIQGLLRFAGAAPLGFVDGRLASYRFVVLRANSVRTLSLVVDEMHMISRLDAKPALTMAPMRTPSR